MLRADSLALAAFDTIAGLSARLGVDLAIVIIRVPILKVFFSVHAGEQIWDGDVFGTAIHAVATGSAGDEVLSVEDVCYPLHSLSFLSGEGMEPGAHRFHVVQELVKVAHAGQRDHHILQPRHEPQSVAGIAAAHADHPAPPEPQQAA